MSELTSCSGFIPGHILSPLLGPPRRYKSSRLYPDVAPEKSRQPVRKLAAAQTNPINVPSAGKSDKSRRYQRSLSPEADTTSHGAKYVSFALKYLSSHHMRPRWWRWLQLKETGTCPSCLPPAQPGWSAAPGGPISPPSASNPPLFPPCCSTVGSTNSYIGRILRTSFRRPFSTSGNTLLINQMISSGPGGRSFSVGLHEHVSGEEESSIFPSF